MNMFNRIISDVLTSLAGKVGPTCADKYNLIGKTLRASGWNFPAKFRFVQVKKDATLLMVKQENADVPDVTIVVGGYRLDTDTCIVFTDINCQKAQDLIVSGTSDDGIIPGHRAHLAVDFKHRAISHDVDAVDEVDVEMVLWCIRHYGDVTATFPKIEYSTH